jgi:hypothetical protein
LRKLVREQLSGLAAQLLTHEITKHFKGAKEAIAYMGLLLLLPFLYVFPFLFFHEV